MVGEFPVSVRVVRTLRERILSGHYMPGSWLPPERDLAAEFGVSRPVVREALAALSDMGLLGRKMGCRPRVMPTESALSPRIDTPVAATTATATIAAVLPQLPAYATAQAILRGISAALQQHDSRYRLTIRDTHTLPCRDVPGNGHLLAERDVLRALAGEGAAGVIVWPMSGEDAVRPLEEIEAGGVAVVYIDRYPAGLNCDYVGVDNYSGVQMAVEHLVGLGHRRIAYLSNSERITSVQEREEGFRDALASAPDAAGVVYQAPAEMRTDLSATADYVLSLPDRPTAVVALNDLHAFAFIREIELRGLSVPRDISVVGFDDVECYSPHPAVLTTVHQPFFQIGRRAAELLLRRIEGCRPSEGAPRQHVVLPTRLVVRSTTGPAAVGPQAVEPGAPVQMRPTVIAAAKGG